MHISLSFCTFIPPGQRKKPCGEGHDSQEKYSSSKYSPAFANKGQITRALKTKNLCVYNYRRQAEKATFTAVREIPKLLDLHIFVHAKPTTRLCFPIAGVKENVKCCYLCFVDFVCGLRKGFSAVYGKLTRFLTRWAGADSYSARACRS